MAHPPAPHAFPRTARLRASGDFTRVQRSGRSFDLGAVVIRVAPTPAGPDGAPPVAGRLGLAISRKVGNSVVRNRVKRLFREAFRRRRAVLPGRDLVVIGRPPAAALAPAEVERLLEELLRRLGG